MKFFTVTNGHFLKLELGIICIHTHTHIYIYMYIKYEIGSKILLANHLVSHYCLNAAFNQIESFKEKYKNYLKVVLGHTNTLE